VTETIGKVFARAEAAEARVKELEAIIKKHEHAIRLLCEERRQR
jgi:hypothetical protein